MTALATLADLDGDGLTELAVGASRAPFRGRGEATGTVVVAGSRVTG